MKNQNNILRNDRAQSMIIFVRHRRVGFKTIAISSILIVCSFVFICGCNLQSTTYAIERDASGKVRSIAQEYYDGSQAVLDGQYVIFKDNGDQIEYTMKHNERNGLAVYRDSAGNILYSANFVDDEIFTDSEDVTKYFPDIHPAECPLAPPGGKLP